MGWALATLFGLLPPFFLSPLGPIKQSHPQPQGFMSGLDGPATGLLRVGGMGGGKCSGINFC